MIDRPSRRAATRPAAARMFRLAESVLARVSVARAISPAAMPAGPAWTSRLNPSRRPGWASAPRAVTARVGSIARSAAGFGGRLRRQSAACADRRLGFQLRVFAVGGRLAEGEEGLPAQPRRVLDPALVRLRVAA